ncbi:MAG: glutaredoxin domain-containing protein [Pseudomonadota bacterium]|nr:glutaredoxin domain-containing protein [Pseudomonadota bacterium]
MTIKIYTKDHCPYCGYAKRLLDSLEQKYEEIPLRSDREAIMALVDKTGMKTLPQIFIHNELIGGYDDLKSLVDSGKLDDVLSK